MRRTLWGRGVVVWLVMATMLLVGCQTLSKIPLQTKAAKEREIATLRTEFAAQMDAKSVEITAQFQRVIDGLRAQMRGATDGLYAADRVYDTLPAPDRDEIVVNNFVNESWKALGNEMPSYEQVTKLNERLKAELDESRTSLDDLRRNHDAAMTENQKLSDATKQALDKLVALQAERDQMEREYRLKLDVLQGELVEAQGQIIALEKQRADDRAAIQAMKMKLALVTGGLGLAALAGAIWSPFFKRQFGIFAAVCGAITVGIFYVQPIHVGIAAGVGVVCLIAWVLIERRKDGQAKELEERLGDSLVLGLQRVKEQSKEKWKEIAPVLQDAMGRYETVNGKTVVVPDPALQALVDQKLAAYEQK